MTKPQHKWEVISIERDDDDARLLLSETARMVVDGGVLYRTVLYQAPSSIAVAMTFARVTAAAAAKQKGAAC